MKGKQLYLFSFHKDAKKAHNRYKIIFPSDTLILLGAAAIILLTISFSLGVERGKKVASSKVKLEEEKLENRIKLLEVLAKTNEKEQKINKDTKIQNATDDNKNIANEGKEKFQIQVASFRKENSAQKEAKGLKKTGYPVSIAKKGKYVVIYVGSFDSKDEAKNNLETLRKKYKDCILRRL